MWPAEIRSFCCLALANRGSVPGRGQVAQQEEALGDKENDDDHDTSRQRHDGHDKTKVRRAAMVAPLDVKERNNNEEKD